MADVPHWSASQRGKTEDWYQSEEPLRTVIVRELQRHKRRFKAHPLRSLAVASLLTSLVLLKLATKPKAYTASVTLRATQGSLSDDKGSPLPNRELNEYIYSYVLNTKLLEKEIIT
ncbi:MAG: hypothetical protein AAGC55_19685, partial [Myxococcota bacterium]